MNFDDRMQIVQAELSVFLDRFSPPRGMSDPAVRQTLKSICESIVRKLPLTSENVFRENLKKSLRNVLDKHETYSWPTQATFVTCLHFGATEKRSAPETTDFNEFELNAKRIVNGDPVPERFIWGKASGRVVGVCGVTQDHLNDYRRGSVSAFIKTYNSDSELVSRYGNIVLPYLNNHSGAVA